jgi:hypothetical protein
MPIASPIAIKMSVADFELVPAMALQMYPPAAE